MDGSERSTCRVVGRNNEIEERTQVVLGIFLSNS